MSLANLSFDWSLLGPPLLAGLVVVSTHVLMGRRVLERGIIFIDLTIAQVAALGVIVAEALGLASAEGGATWQTQLYAAGAALLAAAVLTWTEHRLRKVQEALIGSLYVLSASVAILVLSHNPHGAEHMEQLLAGQILWVGLSQVWPTAILYAGVLSAWFLWARHRPLAFYFLFAITVTASVQLVGVYLVFATLILPALATWGLDERVGLPLGYAIGAASYLLGLWLSVLIDLPAGPLIVATLAALALICSVARMNVKAMRANSGPRSS